MLEAYAREQLLKIQQVEKGLAGAVVTCKLWRLTALL
jgi:hypothetical protein